ncbi:hypothetical protein ONS96_000042 [Cadophora gregata f. sp. sojae]|nr:hypothetical protein ONS96_000042 [Cadophora gregata f. sp. sojae]
MCCDSFPSMASVWWIADFWLVWSFEGAAGKQGVVTDDINIIACEVFNAFEYDVVLADKVQGCANSFDEKGLLIKMLALLALEEMQSSPGPAIKSSVVGLYRTGFISVGG